MKSIRWIGTGALVLAALFLATMGMVAWDGLHDRIGPADVALVLGTGGLNRDGTPSHRLRARLQRLLEADRATPFQAIVVSGSPSIGGHDEAAAMENYLAARGVDRARIVADPGGWTTYDSARNTAALLQAHAWRGVVVVTQYFHVTRTRLALARFGVAPVYTLHARLVERRDFYALAREVAGCGAYLFKDYRKPVPIP